ncbi:bifunctional serine/threonine-protein kinase/formylglycine-generating enzyme family protein [Gemmata sp. JC673]|uniref:Bifunctional serine/threonine-protein kinase/formylglycine-generating enzyme family protein n=1 Tax=Gemmata algarum TaxID=2975278 RepID=A0ABU5F4F2_9BACT|nr:bifunctional serine/threonine-protein kinase/formylglycine-generating enzyme family protein [Gemmata algarum]MDY3562443.1 bifunctional serine/threonine-protein kinase/formylglycine-generating enzyme family protein [Gemmata algarum]
MSSTFENTTRARTPADAHRSPPGAPPVFASGSAVPGLNSWVLEQKLGGGGFGEVWLARHAWDAEQPPRAVKFCTDPGARHQLVTHEQNVVRRVMKYAGKHPNIVPLLECNLDGDVPWLMYEFVPGGTLAGTLAKWRRMSPRRRIDLAVQTLYELAAALGACHRFDPPLVHRDMKPHNVLMAGGKVPRITDFGIGGIALHPSSETDFGSSTAGAARLPSELRAAGTRIYAPQEQLLGSEPHPRDDVYALGIIAYQLVTADINTAPGTDAAYELRKLHAPEVLVELVLRSASINPESRPHSATEWEDALGGLLCKTHPDIEQDDPPAPETVDVPPSTATLAARTEAFQASSLPESPAPLPEPSVPSKRTDTPRIKANWRVGPTVSSGRGRVRQVTNAWVAVAALLVFGVLVAGVVYVVSGGPGRFRGTAGTYPGEVRAVPLPGGAEMTFCWVPPGERQLGSPASEREAVLKQFSQSPLRISAEAEDTRGRFRTPGFWLGRYEVTQAEWGAVMADTPFAHPSHFRPGGSHADKLGSSADTIRFPVEGVTWNECQEFVARLNGIAARAGARGRFALPTEDMWEYACRGTDSGSQPFHFGRELNGTQANVDGTAPFGTASKGPNLDRPAVVGSYAGQHPHPWGLCDMHGNVWEWCENKYDGTIARVVRGGSWFNQPHDARSANRNWHSPEARRPDIGVRVCWIPE